MKKGKDVNELLSMPARFIITDLEEENISMSEEEEDRALDRFLDSI